MLAAIEHRHLAKQRARLEHGERFFAAAGDVTADTDIAFDDQIQAVAGLALLEDVLSRHEFLLAAHLGDAGEFAIVEVLEDGDLFQEFGDGRHTREMRDERTGGRVLGAGGWEGFRS